MVSNIPEMIVMIRHILLVESCTVLRTMLVAAACASRGCGMTRLLLVAAALIVVLAAAGVGAGAEWGVYPGAGTPIQTAIDGAGAGDTIFVYDGTYYENLKINKDNLTIIGESREGVIIDGSDKLYAVEIVAGVDNIEICELSI